MSRTPEEIAADQAFFEHARKQSPKYPTLNQARLARQRRHEEIAARTMMALVFVAPALYFLKVLSSTPSLILMTTGLVGFVIVWIVACSRHHGDARHKNNRGDA